MSETQSQELKALHATLIEALSKASIGDFNTEINLESVKTPESREILAGIRVLLESIRDKVRELEIANQRLESAHNRSVNILNEVLKKST